MGLIDKVRRRLMFWRKQTAPGDLTVDGCFTLPGAGVDPAAGGPAEVCAVGDEAGAETAG
jgi:hypothetical protein